MLRVSKFGARTFFRCLPFHGETPYPSGCLSHQMDGIPTLFWSTHFRLATPVFLVAMLFVWWLLYLKQPWFSAKEHPSADDFFYWTRDISIESTCCTWSKSICFLLNSQSFFAFIPGLWQWRMFDIAFPFACWNWIFWLRQSTGLVESIILKHNIFLQNKSSSSWLYPHISCFLMDAIPSETTGCSTFPSLNQDASVVPWWKVTLLSLKSSFFSCLNPFTFHILKLNLWHLHISTPFKAPIPGFFRFFFLGP